MVGVKNGNPTIKAVRSGILGPCHACPRAKLLIGSFQPFKKFGKVTATSIFEVDGDAATFPFYHKVSV